MYQAGVPLVICEFANLLVRNNGKDYGSIRYRTGSLGCYVRTSQRGKKCGIYAGHDNHFYGHRKILKPNI